MADLTELEASQSVKISGSNSSGTESNFAEVNTTGNLLVVQTDKLGTDTITAFNDTVAVNTQACSTVIFTITGTWVATLVAEGTVDGTTWIAIAGINIALHTLISSITVNATWEISCGGFSQVRLRASLFTSGTVNIAYDSSPGVNCRDYTYGNNGEVLPAQAQLVGGSDGVNMIPLLVDDEGRLVTSAITGFGADFAYGDVTTSVIAKVLVNRTTYTEQTTNAQRSIASSNANDTAAGTGARTIRIIYLDQTGAGPFEETITLNGTSYVNTVATNICFIEQMRVITGGSTGSNVGILTLKAATAGGGATIGTIGATDKTTFWTHHYVPIDKECNITGISAGHNGTTVGSGGLFTIDALDIGVDNAIERQVSDFVRLYGQTSTFSRSYASPIKVPGPARLRMFILPETASSVIYRGAFDFFEP